MDVSFIFPVFPTTPRNIVVQESIDRRKINQTLWDSWDGLTDVMITFFKWRIREWTGIKLFLKFPRSSISWYVWNLKFEYSWQADSRASNSRNSRGTEALFIRGIFRPACVRYLTQGYLALKNNLRGLASPYAQHLADDSVATENAGLRNARENIMISFPRSKFCKPIR